VKCRKEVTRIQQLVREQDIKWRGSRARFVDVVIPTSDFFPPLTVLNGHNARIRTASLLLPSSGS
jgi:hypothetical protein